MTLKKWLAITIIADGYAIRINGKEITKNYNYRQKKLMQEYFDKKVISVSIYHSTISFTVV